MSEQIKVGDLVRVRCVCCAKKNRLLGYFGTVTEISSLGLNTSCCGTITKDSTARVPDCASHEHENTGWYPLAWLKRIPPLSELEGEKRDEKLTEPA